MFAFEIVEKIFMIMSTQQQNIPQTHRVSLFMYMMLINQTSRYTILLLPCFAVYMNGLQEKEKR